MNATITYAVEIHYPTDDYYLTMEQCHVCDKLTSGMIEQVTGDLVLWHTLSDLQDAKIAAGWMAKNLSKDWQEVTLYRVIEYADHDDWRPISRRVKHD